MEIKLRCLHDSKNESYTGRGGTSWGFRDSGMRTCTDSILFVSHSPESDDEGLFARCGVGGTFVFKEKLTGVDIKKWHTYTILWEPSSGTFLIDGEVVANTEKVPSYSMIAHTAIHNMVYLEGERITIDVPYNQHIQIDYIRIFGVPEPTLLVYTDVTVDDAYEMLSGDPPIFILDVRTESEYESDGHIPGAYLIPHTEVKIRTDELPIDKGDSILVYCRSGGRSSLASQDLADLGYTDVRNMLGGFSSWAGKGYQLIKSETYLEGVPEPAILSILGLILLPALLYRKQRRIGS
jgi:rhodanese-related sulfurtransferase